LSAFAVENPIDTFNEKEKYGTISGRVQSLSMYRDYEGAGNGFNSSMGLMLNYLSPELGGFDFGFSYIYSWELYGNNNTDLLANDDVNLFNEAWMRYHVTTNTPVTVGRKVNNGEVFRADNFRQQARSIEAVQVEIGEIEDLSVVFGHAIRMSNWIQVGDRAEFNDFGDVFGADEDTDGVTWGEMVYTGIDGLELALYDAYVHDVANLIGTRAKLDITDETAVLGYYRHENEVGSFDDYNSDAFGISVQQKVGKVLLEPGVFSVHGSNMRFQEATTGINHALGSSMMIYGGQFNGGADTYYLKASTQIADTKLYALYNYTTHDTTTFEGQELNFVATQIINDHLSVALKVGVGYRDVESSDNTFANDTRLYVTYNF
jgi:hypothetical protein